MLPPLTNIINAYLSEEGKINNTDLALENLVQKFMLEPENKKKAIESNKKSKLSFIRFYLNKIWNKIKIFLKKMLNRLKIRTCVEGTPRLSLPKNRVPPASTIPAVVIRSVENTPIRVGGTLKAISPTRSKEKSCGY